jgi:hypothetical protein
MGKAKPKNWVVGRWLIESMEQWDRDFIDEEVRGAPRLLIFRPNCLPASQDRTENGAQNQQKATVNISLWCDSTYSHTSTLRSAAVVPDCVAAVQSSAFLHMRLASPEFGRPKSPPPTCQTHNGPALLQSPSTENHHLRSKERPVLPDFHGENKRKGSTGSFAARAWGRNSSTTPPPGSCRVRADLRCAILAGLKTPWIVSAPPPRRRTSGSTHLN